MEILGYILAGVSIETLTVIALNRYLCVARPLLYRRVFTKRRAIIIAAVTWAGTASYLGLGIPLSGIEFRPSPTKVVCVPFLKDEKVSLLKLVVLLFYALTFLIASLIIPICYVKVFLAFRRHNAKVASSLQAPMSIRNSHVNGNDIAFDRKDSLCTVNVNVAFDRRDSVGTVNVNVVSGQQDPIGTGNIALDQQDSVGTVNVNTVGGQQDRLVLVLATSPLISKILLVLLMLTPSVVNKIRFALVPLTPLVVTSPLISKILLVLLMVMSLLINKSTVNVSAASGNIAFGHQDSAWYCLPLV